MFRRNKTKIRNRIKPKPFGNLSFPLRPRPQTHHFERSPRFDKSDDYVLDQEEKQRKEKKVLDKIKLEESLKKSLEEIKILKKQLTEKDTEKAEEIASLNEKISELEKTAEMQQKEMEEKEKNLSEREIKLEESKKTIRKGILKYTLGSGFINKKEEIEARLTRLGIFNRYKRKKEIINVCKAEYKEDKKLKTFYKKDYLTARNEIPLIEFLSGIRRSNSVAFDKEPDYRIWCLSILKEMWRDFSCRSGLEKMTFDEEFLCDCLNMVDLELKKNNQIFQTQDKINIISHLKSLIARFFSKKYIYNEIPKIERKSIPGGYSMDYGEIPINHNQLLGVSAEIKTTLESIKKYLNLICDNLETNIFSKEKESEETIIKTEKNEFSDKKVKLDKPSKLIDSQEDPKYEDAVEEFKQQ